MTYIEWHRLMEEDGWQKHHAVTDDVITIEWRHRTAKKADGTPITVDLNCANLHRFAGTTPPPF